MAVEYRLEGPRPKKDATGRAAGSPKYNRDDIRKLFAIAAGDADRLESFGNRMLDLVDVGEVSIVDLVDEICDAIEGELTRLNRQTQVLRQLVEPLRAILEEREAVR